MIPSFLIVYVLLSHVLSSFVISHTHVSLSSRPSCIYVVFPLGSVPDHLVPCVRIPALLGVLVLQVIDPVFESRPELLRFWIPLPWLNWSTLNQSLFPIKDFTNFSWGFLVCFWSFLSLYFSVIVVKTEEIMCFMAFCTLEC